MTTFHCLLVNVLQIWMLCCSSALLLDIHNSAYLQVCNVLYLHPYVLIKLPFFIILPDCQLCSRTDRCNLVLLMQVPVRHLVFMVHGIGQRLEKSNLVDDVGNFRHITVHLAERHLTLHQRGTQRVLFIPCQVNGSYYFNSDFFSYAVWFHCIRNPSILCGI